MAAAFGLAACQPSGSAAVTLDRSPAGLEQVPLTVTTADRKVHRFTVEVARTPEEQATGMMNRESLAPDRGMIFPYDPPVEASFWMKNTLIPLDMIFVRADGTIARIEANAAPLSLEPVMAGEPVGAVLELAGGRSAELGIQAGDKVEW
ncbi:DUF192 domain-containing protein [Sphingomonas rhizophila]|uniref:DUF192 domain-containing protein n=1 Tax=Sphingomonas rhizophila TaxID=2071607 RepID=A0A7G9S8W1_9SPHN|nr:DUF192 domain-containing protein [Sphingomonas rhizophila]QNN64286.1 DUF192 domain-containing protein [Sphingomonas rhizophila]